MYFFGSRARGTNLPFSDVDLGILIDNPRERLKDELSYFNKVYEAITDDVSDSSEKKLDISFLQKANPVLGMKAVQEGEVIMDRDKRKRVDFEELIFKLYNDYFFLKREYEEANIKAFS